LRLLLVEDEPFIALDLELLLNSVGHEVVGVADTHDAALEMANETAPEAALVDINLRDGFTGLKVGRALSGEMGCVVAFVTGNAEQVPGDFAGAVAVLEKPFTAQGVEEVAALLQEMRAGAARPPSLRYARLPPRR